MTISSLPPGPRAGPLPPLPPSRRPMAGLRPVPERRSLPSGRAHRRRYSRIVRPGRSGPSFDAPRFRRTSRRTHTNWREVSMNSFCENKLFCVLVYPGQKHSRDPAASRGRRHEEDGAVGAPGFLQASLPGGVPRYAGLADWLRAGAELFGPWSLPQDQSGGQAEG